MFKTHAHTGSDLEYKTEQRCLSVVRVVCVCVCVCVCVPPGTTFCKDKVLNLFFLLIKTEHVGHWYFSKNIILYTEKAKAATEIY